MRLTVNGQEREVPDGLTVEDLLKQFNLKREGIAVEVNRDIIRKADYAVRVLRDGDVVEIVTFVGGG